MENNKTLSYQKLYNYNYNYQLFGKLLAGGEKMMKNHKKNNALNAKEKASFLRRKRLEQGKKLEEVAEGICSVSYLSRIEKNQVEVNEDYYRALFEKLDLNYDDMNTNRKYDYLIDLLVKYLQGSYEEIHKFVVSMINDKYYLDIEIEMVLLLDNIIRGFYEDAKKGIVLIELYENGLSNIEIIFYMFLISLYGYKTNQIKKTLQQLEILERMDIEEDVLKLCIQDIAISTYYRLGYINKAYIKYLSFKNNASVHFFKRQIIIHQIETICYVNIENYHEKIDKLEEIKLGIDNNDIEIMESFIYHYSLIHYFNNEYQKAINIATSKILSPRIVSVVAGGILHQPNEYYQNEYLSIIKNYHFTKYDQIYEDFVNYVKLKISGCLSYKLWEELKTNLTKSYFFDYFIYTFKINELVRLGITCSKSKETLRIVYNLLSSIENICFKHLK